VLYSRFREKRVIGWGNLAPQCGLGMAGLGRVGDAICTLVLLCAAACGPAAAQTSEWGGRAVQLRALARPWLQDAQPCPVCGVVVNSAVVLAEEMTNAVLGGLYGTHVAVRNDTAVVSALTRGFRVRRRCSSAACSRAIVAIQHCAH
jgi:hypothetical protein